MAKLRRQHTIKPRRDVNPLLRWRWPKRARPETQQKSDKGTTKP